MVTASDAAVELGTYGAAVELDERNIDGQPLY